MPSTRMTWSSSQDGWRNSNAARVPAGNNSRKASNLGRSTLKLGGNWKRNGACRSPSTFATSQNRLTASAQSRSRAMWVMRCGAFRANRKPPASRHPCRHHFLGRHPVERVVDFDGGETLGVVPEHPARGERFGIERTLPFRVVVPDVPMCNMGIGGEPRIGRTDRGSRCCQLLPAGSRALATRPTRAGRCRRRRTRLGCRRRTSDRRPLPWPGFVDHQGTSLHLVLVELLHRLLRAFLGCHLDKTKPPRAARCGIPHDLHVGDAPAWLKSSRISSSVALYGRLPMYNLRPIPRQLLTDRAHNWQRLTGAQTRAVAGEIAHSDVRGTR